MMQKATMLRKSTEIGVRCQNASNMKVHLQQCCVNRNVSEIMALQELMPKNPVHYKNLRDREGLIVSSRDTLGGGPIFIEFSR